MRVPVGPFVVDDLTNGALVDDIVSTWAGSGRSRPVTAFALHVGGLNSRRDASFVASMNDADFVYADGGSTVWLARLAGARDVERAPTTDMGWALLREVGQRLGRPARLALVGGSPGLASRAADVLSAGGAGEAVLCEHGYHDDWAPVLERIRTAAPDVCVVGLGAPREMLWVQRWLGELPPSIVLTSGGWFGHIVGDERRAPRLLRRSGLEWIARLAQAPRRLGPRYALGLWSTAAMTWTALVHDRPRS